jgi:hypothetical protein
MASAKDDAALKLAKARKLIERARHARGRANWRTPGTATAERERKTAERYEEEADRLFNEVASFLAIAVRSET